MKETQNKTTKGRATVIRNLMILVVTAAILSLGISSCGDKESDPPNGEKECNTDSDCTEGEEWCEDGFCEECDNSGLQCLIDCEEGSHEMPVRNGCHPCTCVPINECLSDDDCVEGECIPGDMCISWCPAGDPSCCYGNTCT